MNIMFITKVSFLFFIIFESIKPQNMNESTLLSDFGVVIQKSNKSHLKNLNGLS